VAVTHLHKSYESVAAVHDVSFSVAEGEIFGILGPNGAGKTTRVECVSGLREPHGGTIRLLGLDPWADRDQVRKIVGVQLQGSAFPAKLRVGEILDMYRTFYRSPAGATELAEALGLTGRRGRRLSAGRPSVLSPVRARKASSSPRTVISRSRAGVRVSAGPLVRSRNADHL
jgi:ABC-2 type transport system ATP-binding protein